jgi:hypothetical protein
VGPEHLTFPSPSEADGGKSNHHLFGRQWTLSVIGSGGPQTPWGMPLGMTIFGGGNGVFLRTQ